MREPSVSVQSHLTDRAAKAPHRGSATSRADCLPHPHSVDGVGTPCGQEWSGEPPGGADMSWVILPSSGLLSQLPFTTVISLGCNYPLLFLPDKVRGVR